MSRLSPILAVAVCLPLLSSRSFAIEPAQPTQAIPSREIGPKYHIEGDFGPLFTDFTIKGVVVEAPSKRFRDLDDKTVWLDISEVNGKALEPARQQVMVYTDSKFTLGSKVELVLREEGRLYSQKDLGIDAVLSNPNRTLPVGGVFCELSLHLRKVLGQVPAKQAPAVNQGRGK